jgi:Na+-transporting NADH:ubiquinone oxidoreductase subunit C
VKDSLYTVGYAGVLGIVCAMLLTGVASFTAPYRADNARVEEVLSILTALGIPHEPDASAAQLLEIFESNVREAEHGGSTVYMYIAPGEEDKPKAIAMKFAGPGLWGPIEGFLALEADGKTIRGLTFSRQEETPGLGGEIAAPWFREQFVGKSIVDRAGRPRIFIGGHEGAPNAVNAITGATMTCDKLEAILDQVAAKFIEESHEKQ